MRHRNTVASSVAGAIAVVALYLLTLVSFNPPSYVASALTTLVIAAALFVGAKGFRGLLRLIWRGQR